MKLLRAFALLTFTVASVYASGGEANNEITHYGCPDECTAQKSPSCSKYDDDNLPSHFAALSTKLSGYDSYCGNYAVYMMADGSNVNTIAKATVVDSCSSCAKYHLDLSEEAFTEIREKSEGTGKVIWGIYSKSGSKLAGPFYNSVDGSAKKLGMSSDSFISAFDANAKSLASSSSSTRSFNSSSSGSINSTTTTTTTTTTVTSTITGTATATNALQTGVATNNSTIIVKPGVASNNSTNSNKSQNQKQTNKKVEKAIEENDTNDSSIGTTVGILAIGGGCIGAAGAGLLFMKKKNPNTYEGIKQKFPEAFNNVKRGISRRATSIKRRVTRKVPEPSTDAINV